jgi:hypothetical protein
VVFGHGRTEDLIVNKKSPQHPLASELVVKFALLESGELTTDPAASEVSFGFITEEDISILEPVIANPNNYAAVQR